MELAVFLQRLNEAPEQITFNDTIAVIEANYAFTPTAFRNGELLNAADQNNGSCKIFAFGKLQQLGAEKTLQCFGDYYRKDVLGNPGGTDHQNIRNFMVTGWAGIAFEGQALAVKSA